MKLRYRRENSTWYHNFGCGPTTIENIVNYFKGPLLRRSKHALPQEDCVLVFLKWQKWNHSYQLLGEPFQLGKSGVSTLLENHLPLFLRWADQYLQMKSIDELREISRKRINSAAHQSILFVVDSVPTRISESSGPIGRDYHNVHKKYAHVKTQAVVDMDGYFINISPSLFLETQDSVNRLPKVRLSRRMPSIRDFHQSSMGEDLSFRIGAMLRFFSAEPS